MDLSLGVGLCVVVLMSYSSPWSIELFANLVTNLFLIWQFGSSQHNFVENLLHVDDDDDDDGGDDEGEVSSGIMANLTVRSLNASRLICPAWKIEGMDGCLCLCCRGLSFIVGAWGLFRLGNCGIANEVDNLMSDG